MSASSILVVDDEESVRLVVGRMLRARGFELIEAKDGREALQLVQQREQAPDLVLSDVIMPLLTGGELARKIHASRPEQRILLMSAYAPHELLRRGLYAEHLPFLQKPFTAEQLILAVRTAMS
jgi:two-component system, cell cycle sensor histidine kinase and response regulator CckA